MRAPLGGPLTPRSPYASRSWLLVSWPRQQRIDRQAGFGSQNAGCRKCGIAIGWEGENEPCTDAAAAIPDACIASRAAGPGGDAIVTVRTTHFSKWNFGRLDYAFGGFLRPVDSLPTVNTMKAGSAAPVKFSRGGNKGLNIFQPGSPAQGLSSCDMLATDPSSRR